jgi:hypothetical protein
MSLLRDCRVTALGLFLALAAGASAAAQDGRGTISIQEYVGRLDRLASAIAATNGPSTPTAIVLDLPPVWRIETPQRVFQIETTWLVRDLRAWQSRSDPGVRDRLLASLRTLRAEAVAFDQPALDVAALRARLQDILSGREFRSIQGPTWLDRLRQRVFELLVGLLSGVMRSSAIPTVTNVLVYGLIALALTVLVLWAYRLARRDAAHEASPPDSPQTEAREWPLWLADAQTAAAAGRWREGIHFTYWCAVSFLEADGAWRPDRTRTPREYVKLVPSASERGSTLKALTRQFELVWYGTNNADERGFVDAMASLKKIGCPPA